MLNSKFLSRIMFSSIFTLLVAVFHHVKGSEMIMEYEGSMFLVKTGCPRSPAYFVNSIFAASRYDQKRFENCIKNADQRQVKPHILLSIKYVSKREQKMHIWTCRYLCMQFCKKWHLTSRVGHSIFWVVSEKLNDFWVYSRVGMQFCGPSKA